MVKKYKSYLKSYSRKLRTNMTNAEQLLWKHIRRKQIRGVLFNRQKPIDGYIVDFYCSQVNLVVEIDGGQHFVQENIEADSQRDQELSKRGLLILRFDNFQVLNELEFVLARIYDVVSERI